MTEWKLRSTLIHDFTKSTESELQSYTKNKRHARIAVFVPHVIGGKINFIQTICSKQTVPSKCPWIPVKWKHQEKPEGKGTNWKLILPWPHRLKEWFPSCDSETSFPPLFSPPRLLFFYSYCKPKPKTTVISVLPPNSLSIFN